MTPEIHINTYTLILFLGGCQGLLFSLLLLFKHQAKRIINVHLAVLLFSISSETLHQFLIETHYIYQLPALAGFILPLDALVGISLYWYVRIITHPQQDHSVTRILCHYSIFIVCVLLSIPYWGLGLEAKLDLIRTGVIGENWPAYVYYAVLAQIPIKIISFCVYLLLAIRLLIAHQKRIKDIFSYREKITLSWLTALLILFVFGLVNGLAVLIFFQEYAESTQLMGFMPVFSIVAVFYIGVMGLMQPVIYLRKERSYIKHIDETEPSVVATSNKYKKSSLSEDDMLRIADKLNRVMAQQKLFLQPNLTMPQLASAIPVSPNYLSQTLNCHYRCNFFDYINALRIDYAKNLLTDPSNTGLSVLDIAMASAFNSRSTFYNAFKQIVGMTPAQYKNQALSQI